jgi:nucleoside-diphosphate-sugar epimerase
LRILLTGATGLIGRAVLVSLHGEGHAVVAVARNADAAARLPEAVACIALDIAKATSPADWLPHLVGIDALVNCAGVLQDSPRDSTAGVHAEGAAALFAACERAGVRRVVQISAIGVDQGATAFARTKLAGDKALMARNLDWAILRPSVVVGRPAYGGSALFRALAALPILPRLADAGPLQIVQLDDLVRTVLFCFGRVHRAALSSRSWGPSDCRWRRCSAPIAAGSAWGRRASLRCRAGWLRPPFGWAISSASSAGGRHCAPQHGANSRAAPSSAT